MFTLAALLYLGLPPSGALLTAGITGFLASGATYLAKLVANLSAEVDPDKLVALFEWLNAAVRALGLPVRRLSLVSTSRGPEGLRLIQVPEPRVSDAQLLETLVITSASRDEPLVRLDSDSATVVMAGRIASTLTEALDTVKGRRVLRLSRPQQLRSLYKLLRSLYQATAKAPRSLAAYMAVKAVGRLVGHGLLTFSDWRLAENALSYIPAEPPWLRFRVRRQIERETIIQP